MRKEIRNYWPVNLMIEIGIVAVGILVVLTLVFALQGASATTVLTFGIPSIILAISVFLAFRLFVMRPLNRMDRAVRGILQGSKSGVNAARRVSELSHLEESVEELYAAVQERIQPKIEEERRRRVLLASICHDLRTPLTSLMGYIEATQDHIGNPEENLRIMYERAEFINKLIDDLDVYAKNDLDELQVYRKKVLADELLLSILSGIKDARIRPVKPVVKAFIYADPYRFVQVIDNVIGNARKHAKTTILIRTDIDEHFYSIRIGDDGDGVPENSRTQIFDPFFTVQKKGDGSGLGLAITKHLMEAHGGSIELLDHSTLGGAEFLIRFPRYVIESNGRQP